MRLFAIGSTLAVVSLGACSGAPEISYPTMGSMSAPSGKGGFRFGVATAATQIEDHDPNTDWYVVHRAAGAGRARQRQRRSSATRSTATRSRSQDVALLQPLHVDSLPLLHRVGARRAATRGMFDEAALKHYGDLIDALRAPASGRSSPCTTSRTRSGSTIRATSPARTARPTRTCAASATRSAARW